MGTSPEDRKFLVTHPYLGLPWSANDENLLSCVINMWRLFDTGVVHWLHEMGHMAEAPLEMAPSDKRFISFHAVNN
jgi:hypothetical protein